jgi:hypothetical protein
MPVGTSQRLQMSGSGTKIAPFFLNKKRAIQTDLIPLLI